MPVEYSAIAVTGVNGSGESIPARSFVKAGASGSDVTLTRGSGSSTFRAVTAEKPDGTSGDAYFVTGPAATADGSQVALYSPATPVWVKFDSAPTGNTCGPVSGEWTASDSGTGFRLLHYESVAGLGLIVASVGGNAGDSSGANCPCRRGTGSVTPTLTDLFGHDQMNSWQVTDPASALVTYLNENGFSVTADDLVAAWDNDTPTNGWISDVVVRTCGEETDDYVLTVEEDATYAFKAIFARVVDEYDTGPNCPDEIYLVFVCSDTLSPYPDRTNNLRLLDKETKTSQDNDETNTYVDPPDGCEWCLLPAVGWETGCKDNSAFFPKTISVTGAVDLGTQFSVSGFNQLISAATMMPLSVTDAVASQFVSDLFALPIPPIPLTHTGGGGGFPDVYRYQHESEPIGTISVTAIGGTVCEWDVSIEFDIATSCDSGAFGSPPTAAEFNGDFIYALTATSGTSSNYRLGFTIGGGEPPANLSATGLDLTTKDTWPIKSPNAPFYISIFERYWTGDANTNYFLLTPVA